MKTFRITSRRTPTNYNPSERWEINETDLAKRIHVKYRGTKSQDIAFTDKEMERGIVINKIEELRGDGVWAIHYEKAGVYPSHFSNTLTNILPDETKPVYAD
jgi:hypothetical protein